MFFREIAFDVTHDAAISGQRSLARNFPLLNPENSIAAIEDIRERWWPSDRNLLRVWEPPAPQERAMPVTRLQAGESPK